MEARRRRFRLPEWIVLGLMLWSGAHAFGQGAAIIRDDKCLQCHGQAHIAELSPAERLTMVGTWLEAEPAPEKPEGETGVLTGTEPAVRPELYLAHAIGGVHGNVRCVECHTDAAQLPHKPVLNTSTCAASCHQSEYELYKGGTHFEAVQAGKETGPTCSDCHGGHEILSVGSRQSPQHRLNSIFLCADCHMHQGVRTPEGYEPEEFINAYLNSAHGKAVAKSGLIAAPTCVDCHGAHGVHPVSDDRSRVHRNVIHETCGSCHVGILNIYEESLHGKLFKDGHMEAPVCTDCHTAHQITHPNEAKFKLASDDRCGSCHQDRLKHYQETFHGKALELGRSNVAACFDCHGHHDIVPVSDPGSRLFGDQKVETCRQCHPSAGPKFAQYIAHADHTNRKDYPFLFWTFVFMTAIVVGTFSFFGLHTGLWVVRSSVLFFRNPKAFRELKAKAKADEESFVRFRPLDRFLHAMVFTSFLLLVSTGMPLKFYYTGWAHTLVDWMGGIEAAAQLHRLGAVITFLYFALHLGSLGRAAWRARERYRDPKSKRFSVVRFINVAFGPDMPLPNWHDVKDFWAHQKWFLGKGPQPEFDKWTYWEKFDYLAVFWGVAMIGVSGLVMWFPEFFTRVLPGWSINVALIIHSDEALLAAGFIFAFHFFNVHFRPEKWPIDSVIFSGRISKTEMLHERKRWYKRLESENRLDSIRVKDEWGQWKKVIHPIGFLAFGIGLVLLVLILYAMGARLISGHT